jgi:hypothetical protein
MTHQLFAFPSKMREADFQVATARTIILDTICESGGHLPISEIIACVQEQKDPSVESFGNMRFRLYPIRRFPPSALSPQEPLWCSFSA